MDKYGWIRPGHTPKKRKWHAVSDCLPNYDNELNADGSPRTDSVLYYRSPSVLLLLGGNTIRTGYLQWHYDAPEKPYRWFLDGRETALALGVTHWRWLPHVPTGEQR